MHLPIKRKTPTVRQELPITRQFIGRFFGRAFVLLEQPLFATRVAYELNQLVTSDGVVRKKVAKAFPETDRRNSGEIQVRVVADNVLVERLKRFPEAYFPPNGFSTSCFCWRILFLISTVPKRFELFAFPLKVLTHLVKSTLNWIWALQSWMDPKAPQQVPSRSSNSLTWRFELFMVLGPPEWVQRKGKKEHYLFSFKYVTSLFFWHLLPRFFTTTGSISPVYKLTWRSHFYVFQHCTVRVWFVPTYLPIFLHRVSELDIGLSGCYVEPVNRIMNQIRNKTRL